jgi:hypothetical protein
LFLIVFVILSAPGAILLFHKKLDPTSPRLDEPDPVLTQLPYMTPLPAPQGMKWIVPPKTFAWLREVTRTRTGSDEILSALGPGPEWEPVISGDHVIQLIAVTPGVHQTHYSLMIWGARAPVTADAISVSVRRNVMAEANSGGRASVVAANPISVPPEVRRELVSLGFGHPPTQVTWVDAVSDSVPAPEGQRITVESVGSKEPLYSWVEFVDRTSSEHAHDRK